MQDHSSEKEVGDAVTPSPECLTGPDLRAVWTRPFPLSTSDFLFQGKWQPIPVFLTGKSYGQRSLMAYSPWDHRESDTTEHVGSGFEGGEGNRQEGDFMLEHRCMDPSFIIVPGYFLRLSLMPDLPAMALCIFIIIKLQNPQSSKSCYSHLMKKMRLSTKE